jgi:hypothetical protein
MTVKLYWNDFEIFLDDFKIFKFFFCFYCFLVFWNGVRGNNYYQWKIIAIDINSWVGLEPPFCADVNLRSRKVFDLNEGKNQNNFKTIQTNFFGSEPKFSSQNKIVHFYEETEKNFGFRSFFFKK